MARAARLCLIWAQYGPYHFARVSALKRLAGASSVLALELASETNDYAWSRADGQAEVRTLCPGAVAEELSFRAVFLQARRVLAGQQIEVCFLPSYAPKQSLAALLACKSLGIRTVMMNETHAGTARATGMTAWFKRRLVGLFDAALVGGRPQQRYFASLGLPESRIFTGYDAVDNDYFAGKAEEARSTPAADSGRFELPRSYFLSLGRFVPKKNLATLVRAYRRFLDASKFKRTHLVMVGSGGEEPALRRLCAELQLPVYDHPAGRPSCAAAGGPAGVHFYGFRQLEENPVFYSRADAFILPSLWEEWGLVVNEAMASGLPVAVSETAGCAEDLLETGGPSGLAPEDDARIEQSGLAPKLRRNGFVFSPHSAEELGRVLLAFEASAGLRALMGAESRRIVGKFSCENFARNALRAVDAALGPRTVPA